MITVETRLFRVRKHALLLTVQLRVLGPIITGRPEVYRRTLLHSLASAPLGHRARLWRYYKAPWPSAGRPMV